MKSRLLLTIASVLSIGIAQAAAHNEPVEIDQAELRRAENKEFALGVAIALLGPAAAEKVGIPFGRTITEAAIRGSIITEILQFNISITEALLGIASIASSIAIIDAPLPHVQEGSALEYITNCGGAAGLVLGSIHVQEYLIHRQIYPLTRNIRKGIMFGSQLRTMRTLLSAERSDSGDTAVVSVGVLSSFALACKTAYDFWHR